MVSVSRSGARTSIETEVKLAVGSARDAKQTLSKAGFKVFRPRVFESNVVLDTSSLALRQSGQLLRLRQAGRIATLTYKGPARPGPHKSREELEVRLPAGSVIDHLFARLGYTPVFRYEKYRTEFSRAGEPGHATLDETPIGNFIELEGPADWIDQTAADLGFVRADYITVSYAALYLADCARRNLEPSHMVFQKD